MFVSDSTDGGAADGGAADGGVAGRPTSGGWGLPAGVRPVREWMRAGEMFGGSEEVNLVHIPPNSKLKLQLSPRVFLIRFFIKRFFCMENKWKQNGTSKECFGYPNKILDI